jgi:hypothetical protein
VWTLERLVSSVHTQMTTKVGIYGETELTMWTRICTLFVLCHVPETLIYSQ